MQNPGASVPYRPPRRRPEISIAPLIDMIFLLLIFFVVTTTFTRETGMKINKAKASTVQTLQKEQMLIAIDSEGRIGYDKQIWTLEGIARKVSERIKEKPNMVVVLIPDKDARGEPLIEVMDALRLVGAQRLSIGAKKVIQE
jgi:biopolymer transport protein ExbD